MKRLGAAFARGGVALGRESWVVSATVNALTEATDSFTEALSVTWRRAVLAPAAGITASSFAGLAPGACSAHVVRCLHAVVVNLGGGDFGWLASVTVTLPAGDQFSVQTWTVKAAAWLGLMLLAERVTARQSRGGGLLLSVAVRAAGAVVLAEVLAQVLAEVLAGREPAARADADGEPIAVGATLDGADARADAAAAGAGDALADGSPPTDRLGFALCPGVPDSGVIGPQWTLVLRSGPPFGPGRSTDGPP
jgi:hypothetical protein